MHDFIDERFGKAIPYGIYDIGRNRLWKLQLQGFANESGLDGTVAHHPRGTSEWNKIEHRMFCHITQNWRGRPLESVETVVSLIGSTATKTGLCIKATSLPQRPELHDPRVPAVTAYPSSLPSVISDFTSGRWI